MLDFFNNGKIGHSYLLTDVVPDLCIWTATANIIMDECMNALQGLPNTFRFIRIYRLCYFVMEILSIPVYYRHNCWASGLLVCGAAPIDFLCRLLSSCCTTRGCTAVNVPLNHLSK